MNWNEILSTLGDTIVLCAMAGWLIRQLIGQLLNKDIEVFKHKLQVAAGNNSVVFTSLHEKRAAFIADLYGRLHDLHGSIFRLKLEYDGREIREDIERKYRGKDRKEWDLQPGIDFLNESEKATIEAIRESLKSLYDLFHRNMIYLDGETAFEINRFLGLAGYIQMSYENIAIKDAQGNLYVDHSVKELWNRAYDTIPTIKDKLHRSFQGVLGVKMEN